MVNKSFDDKRFSIQPITPGFELVVADSNASLQANSEMKRVFLLKKSKQSIEGYKQPVAVQIFIDNRPLRKFETTFFGPIVIKE